MSDKVTEKDPRFRSQKFRDGVRGKLEQMGLDPTFKNFKKYDAQWSPKGFPLIDWMSEEQGPTIVQCVDEDGLPVGQRFGLLNPLVDFDPETMRIITQW